MQTCLLSKIEEYSISNYYYLFTQRSPHRKSIYTSCHRSPDKNVFMCPSPDFTHIARYIINTHGCINIQMNLHLYLVFSIVPQNLLLSLDIIGMGIN